MQDPTNNLEYDELEFEAQCAFHRKVKHKAWCEGRDAAAARAAEMNDSYISGCIQALKSPYEEGE